MKNLITTILVIGLGVCSLMYLSFIFGEKSKQDEIEMRSLQIDKDCYNKTDIETIIFNEHQI
jgi:hypothetical protein